MTDVASFVIPSDNVETLTKKLDQLNRRAAKLGTAPIAVTFAPDHVETWTETTESGREIARARAWVRADVTGAVVVLAGWKFRAAIHHTTDGNLVASLPGSTDLPAAYRESQPVCDHCRTTRLRSSTYVVENVATGELRQVGRQCLADFTGSTGNDPMAMARWAEMIGAFLAWFSSFDEDGNRYAWTEPVTSLFSFLETVAAVIRKDGWLSRGAARTNAERGDGSTIATADTAWRIFWMIPKTREDREELRRYETEEVDTTLATATVQWGATLDARTDLNDYLHNLSVVSRSLLVSRKTAGLAASMVVAYQKELNLIAERAREATRAPSSHVGEIGERLRGVKVTVVRVVALEGNEFGPRSIVGMTDETGNDLNWFTGWTSVEIGDVRWLTGTVKAHGEFKGRKQTTLSRCVLDETAPAPKPAKKGRGKAAPAA
jgi:hypothetical protein